MGEKTLNDIKKEIRRYGTMAASTEKDATDSLYKAGICDKQGNLKAPYK
ncbi:MAG: hypothetical protein JW881_04560 [Spirochaetales bacterium]|nr:hypothetical protein [Spirochaetales bacterium]